MTNNPIAATMTDQPCGYEIDHGGARFACQSRTLNTYTRPSVDSDAITFGEAADVPPFVFLHRCANHVPTLAQIDGGLLLSGWFAVSNVDQRTADAERMEAAAQPVAVAPKVATRKPAKKTTAKRSTRKPAKKATPRKRTAAKVVTPNPVATAKVGDDGAQLFTFPISGKAWSVMEGSEISTDAQKYDNGSKGAVDAVAALRSMTGRKIGRGVSYVCTTTREGAETIADYCDTVGGSFTGSDVDDADVKNDGRALLKVSEAIKAALA